MIAKIKKMFPKEQAWLYWLTLLTAILITWSGIVFGQKVFRIAPLYISLFVSLLMANANRYAPLIGSINCLLYCVALASVKLYASAAQTLFISAPMQFITFVRWNNQPYKQSTQFRQLNKKQWILTGTGFVVGFFLLKYILAAADANSQLLDTICTLIGFCTSILTMLSFREYAWTSLIGNFLSIFLYLSLLPTHPEQLTYVFYAIHGFTCTIMQFICVRKLYKEQQSA